MTPETAEKRSIKDYLLWNKWFVYHNLAGLGVFAGISDLTAIKNGVVLQIEVKTEKGVQSEKQKVFQKEWEDKGGKYVCGDANAIIAFCKDLEEMWAREF